jgi:predicted metal-dependent peptidase
MTISQAKFRLYNKSPFLGTVIFNLPTFEAEDIPTAGVDGVNLYVNMKYWESLSNIQQIGLLAHECGHLFLAHPLRMGERKDLAVNPQTGEAVTLWNIACDYAINPLVAEALGRDYLPTGALYENKYIEWSTEKIYEDLKKNIPKMSQSQMNQLIKGILKGEASKWGKLKGQEKKDAEGRVKQILGQAIEAQKSKGDVSSMFKRLFDELEPKEDWRKVLMEYIQPYFNDYNFSKPDRRYLEQDFFLPDIKEGEKIDWLAVAVDTSGSIGKKELDHFISEIKAILGSYDKVKIKLTFCDAEALPFVELDQYEPEKIKVAGGGGTDFKPVFDLIRKEDSRPQALIYFTDLMGDFPRNKPDYDVVWINTEKSQKAPFGKVLEYNAN